MIPKLNCTYIKKVVRILSNCFVKFNYTRTYVQPNEITASYPSGIFFQKHTVCTFFTYVNNSTRGLQLVQCYLRVIKKYFFWFFHATSSIKMVQHLSTAVLSSSRDEEGELEKSLFANSTI